MTETSESRESISLDDGSKKEANSSMSSLRRELVCSICFENYNQLALKPVSLVPCGHSVCSKCVEKLEKKTCPTCKEPFSIHIFNWAVIGLLPKPTVDEIKNQVKRSIEENSTLLNEMDRLSKLTCFESVRKEIEDKYTELTSDLQMQKRELLSKISSIEKKCGVRTEIAEKIQKDLRQYQSDLSKTNEISECRLESMIKILQIDLEQLQDNIKNLRKISTEPPVMRFRPQTMRLCNLIGELTYDHELNEINSLSSRRRARVPDIINQARESSFQRIGSFLRNNNLATTSTALNSGFTHIRRRANDPLSDSPFTGLSANEILFSLRNRPTESPIFPRRDSGGSTELW